MGFDDFIKDLFGKIDWGDIAGSFLKWLAENPNIYAMGFEMVMSLFRVIDEIRGMSEEEAKASFAAKIHHLIDKPDLLMDFEI